MSKEESRLTTTDAAQEGEWHVWGTVVCNCTDGEHFVENWANATDRKTAERLRDRLNLQRSQLRAAQEERDDWRKSYRDLGWETASARREWLEQLHAAEARIVYLEAQVEALEGKAALADSLLKPDYYMPSDIMNAWEKHKDAYDALKPTTSEQAEC